MLFRAMSTGVNGLVEATFVALMGSGLGMHWRAAVGFSVLKTFPGPGCVRGVV